MNEVILNNLETKLCSNDTLFFLGDLTFIEEVAESFFERFSYLKIHFLIGNHDSSGVIKIAKKSCESVSACLYVTVNDQDVICTHDPGMFTDFVFKKTIWYLHGHSHGRLESINNNYDVGIDNCNYFPVSFRDLLRIKFF